MGRAFLGSRWQVVWKIVLPSAAPVIFAGLRLGCASGFIGVILAELLITPTGIGDIITYNQSIAAYAKMYAAIFSVIVFSVLFIELLERLAITLFRPEKRASRCPLRAQLPRPPTPAPPSSWTASPRPIPPAPKPR